MDLRDTLDYKLLPLLDTVLTDSHQHARRVKFHKKHSQHHALMCLYCTIIELAHGQKALLRKGQTTALPVVLRSIFEAYADLRAVINDATYTKRMEATFIEQKALSLKNAVRTPDNRFFEDMRSGMDLPQELSRRERELEALRREGAKPLKTYERFQAGGLEHEYQSTYWLLCLEGHNNISALEDRHIEKRGDEYAVVLFKEADPKHLVGIVEQLLQILIDSGIRVHKFLDSEAAKRFEAHGQTLRGTPL